MIYMLRFAHGSMLLWLIPLVILVALFRVFLYRPSRYRFSLSKVIGLAQISYAPTFKKVFFIVRLISLALLVFLIAKPQLVDTRSKITVEGIDIVLVMDISGSMQHQDYSDDNRSRLDVAKEEAIRFIQKRTDDAIGLVLFAKDALSRVPLTLDKKLLAQVVDELYIGAIDPDGTRLSTAIMVAANRLRAAHAKSKVMILLTDGEPSPGDLSPEIAIDTAKKLGIKIYTIGIGSEETNYFLHPVYGILQMPKVNKQLLARIADQTGGKAFMAHNATDMRVIYDTIDSLEKSSLENPIFNNYYDIFIPFVVILIILLFIELVLSTFIWFGI